MNKAFLLAAIDKLRASGRPLSIAIDGNSGAGKTSFAKILGQKYGANIIHMDHFFLPEELRTAERLAEIGGNIDYTRFEGEVLQSLAAGKSFSYGVYDCSVGAITGQVPLPLRQINIIEGVYSLHPRFRSYYDLKVFLEVDPLTQGERILARSGYRLYRRFLEEWIPMENKYFYGCDIRQEADFLLSNIGLDI